MENQSNVLTSLESVSQNHQQQAPEAWISDHSAKPGGSFSPEALSASDRLSASIAQFEWFNAQLSGSLPAQYLKTNTLIHQLCESILLAESTLTREEIMGKLAGVRQIHRDSPFFVRAQDWPRGYAGDFETIEYAIQGLNQAPQKTMGYYLESILLSSPIVQQHRNKVRHQAGLILQKVNELPNAKILSIGCGSSADLNDIQSQLANKPVHITLFDMDTDALACSKKKLNLLADKCTFVEGNLYRMVQKLEANYDLIIIGGVFDYLSDKHIVHLLQKLYKENLSPGGNLFFTNIAEGNPYRTWMEYCFNWFLIERSEEKIYNLYQQAALENSSIDIYPEETQLTYLAKLTKKE
jgi:protein-L-isoaspartate O-methyltransferase